MKLVQNDFEKRWSCACNPGFIGNGLTCVEKDTGIKPPEILEETDIEGTQLLNMTRIESHIDDHQMLKYQY